MSSSELIVGNNRDISDAIARIEQIAAVSRDLPIADEHVRQLVGATLRIYARACEAARREIVPVDGDVSTTAAITMACALARSQSLTPFDLALWFSHTAPRDTAASTAEGNRRV